MMLISHRGNLNGKLPDRENEPAYIDEAIAAGYSVEIDMRVCERVDAAPDIWLGHDNLQYQVTLEWLQERQNYLWFHCKNREALEFCLGKKLHCFWHDTDDYTMTSNGYVWAYPGKLKAGMFTILVMPELHWSVEEIKNQRCFGVCSDIVAQLKA